MFLSWKFGTQKFPLGFHYRSFIFVNISHVSLQRARPLIFSSPPGRLQFLLKFQQLTVCMCVRMYVCMYVCVYGYSYTHIYECIALETLYHLNYGQHHNLCHKKLVTGNLEIKPQCVKAIMTQKKGKTQNQKKKTLCADMIICFNWCEVSGPPCLQTLITLAEVCYLMRNSNQTAETY